jgi:hypothetical protein
MATVCGYTIGRFAIGARFVTASISLPLSLPCGQVLLNRVAKAAMTEGLGDPLNRATDKNRVTAYLFPQVLER